MAQNLAKFIPRPSFSIFEHHLGLKTIYMSRVNEDIAVVDLGFLKGGF